MGQAAIDARAVGTGVWSLELDRYATTLSLLLQPPAACAATHAVQAALPLELTQLKTTVPQRRANHASSPNPNPNPDPNPEPNPEPNPDPNPDPNPNQVPNAKATILSEAYDMGAAAPSKQQQAAPVEITSELGRKVEAQP